MTIEFKIQKKLGPFFLDVEGSFTKGVTGLFGESGSGKTTFLHCLAGFLNPDEGEISVQGETIFSKQPRKNRPIEKRNIGMVFQDALLFPHLTVRKNILYGLRRPPEKDFWKGLVDVLNLYALMDRRPQNLSGGERQRAALARTLVRKPKMILMDEPVSSLDFQARHQIVCYLKRVHEAFQIPFVYATHSVSELLYLAKEVFVLKGGRRIAQDRPYEAIIQKNIFSVSEFTDLENIFELTAVKYHNIERTVLLDFGGQTLTVPSPEIVQPRVRIVLKARDILIATVKPQGISARNIIEATIERIVPLEGKVILYTRIKETPCLAEMTSLAFQELQLKEHQRVFLIIKVSSILVVE
jgi:molybdate transport system ATP-binding protein